MNIYEENEKNKKIYDGKSYFLVDVIYTLYYKLFFK